AALAHYRRALAVVPDWDLAARGVGLVLVRQKQAQQAIPFLKLYVRHRAGAADAHAYGREIARFEKEQATRAAEFTRLRPRLVQKDLVMGIKKGYALLEPCLQKARQAQALARGVDTLVLTW